MNWETATEKMTGERLRETAAIMGQMQVLAEMLDRISESVNIGNAALFGPSPEMGSVEKQLKPVPSGFLAETRERLEKLTGSAMRIEKAAQRLRDL